MGVNDHISVDSPAKESNHNITTCYTNTIFGNKSFINSKKAFRISAAKFSNTLRSIRDSFDNLSQRMKINGHRRHRLDENHTPCCTPSSPQKKKEVLGRTPTKLYSPFGIETPHHTENNITPYMPETPDHDLSAQSSKGRSSWRLLPKKHPRVLFR